MADKNGFAEALAVAEGLTETDLAVRICWFIREESGTAPTISGLANFFEENAIRHNINRSRLSRSLQKDNRVSAPKGMPIEIRPLAAREIFEAYSKYLSKPAPKIEDEILVSADFANARGYVRKIVYQINGSFQFGFYDACAVMMRRLVEILIIDAYSALSKDHLIRDSNGELKMLNGLVSELMSARTFKLSRNAPKHLETVKQLGDTAAHNRTYVTKAKDIEAISQSYRMLIDELVGLSS